MPILSKTKIQQNADLIWPFIACFFGEPVVNCPFRKVYRLKDEIKQIDRIDTFSQKELDEMRLFHGKCMSELIKIRNVTFPENYSKTKITTSKM